MSDEKKKPEPVGVSRSEFHESEPGAVTRPGVIDFLETADADKRLLAACEAYVERASAAS